jgi:glycosyltransferase involved in cell wall biosynthesis
VIGAVGRLSAEKAFDLLIRVVHALAQEGTDVVLLIVGEGDERPRLEALIAELNMANRVRLLGYRSDTRDVYQALDAFVLCSFREGLPNVLLEAMALEVPVIATRVAGIPRLVQDGANGLLVEAGDVSALQDAVRRLQEQPELRARLGSAGRATVEARYSFETRMRKIQELYARLGPAMRRAT